MQATKQYYFIIDTVVCQLLFQEVLQLFAAAGMTQLAQCLSLNLTDTLTGNAKMLANLFQSTATAVLQTKA